MYSTEISKRSMKYSNILNKHGKCRKFGYSALVDITSHQNVALHAPLCAPRITSNPVRSGFRISSITDQSDRVISGTVGRTGVIFVDSRTKPNTNIFRYIFLNFIMKLTRSNWIFRSGKWRQQWDRRWPRPVGWPFRFATQLRNSWHWPACWYLPKCNYPKINP